MQIVFQYPTWFLLLAVLAAGGYAFGMYFREKRTSEMPLWLVRTLAGLRGAAVLIIIVLLIGPLIKSTSSRTEKPIVVIAQDNSSSIPLNSDSAFYRSEYQDQLAELKSTLSGDFEVKSYVFGNEINETDKIDFSDGRTDFSVTLYSADARTRLAHPHSWRDAHQQLFTVAN